MTPQRTLLFVDESGFFLLPAVARPYAPIGETPILRHPLTHDHLSVIGAIGRMGKVYFQVHAHAIRSPEVVAFLRHLLRQIRGKLLVVWDGAPIHRRRVVQAFLRDEARAGACIWSASPATLRNWIPRSTSGGL